MFDPAYLGLVIPFAGSTPPAAWMLCQGQELSIPENDALYSLLGTTFGGDGVNTFALPNLCGRVAVHSGQAPGMQAYTQGQTGGNEEVWITINNLPSHNHEIIGNIAADPPSCAVTVGETDSPAGNYPAQINGAGAAYSTAPGEAVNMGPVTITPTSPPAPFSKNETKEPIAVRSPYLAMNYIICIAGVYPPQG
jgi:microcystin-dependent protein